MKQRWSDTIDQAELGLLLACARTPETTAEAAAIRQRLQAGIDWPTFARKAIDHGLASLAYRSLARIAPDMVPGDLLDALRLNTEHTQAQNHALFEELDRLLDALLHSGVEAIPFKGPILGIRAYGDPGLRIFGDPAFLIRQPDMDAAVTTLRDRGYERTRRLNAAQLDFIRYLRGHETLSNRTLGIGVGIYARLTPITLALDIDHAGLWQRARSSPLGGRVMLTLAPEDELLALVIQGGWDRSRSLGWACDVAATIASHPGLNWDAIVQRARAQGCRRMLLLAAALASAGFNADVPDKVRAAARADPVIEAMVRRAVPCWQADQPGKSPGPGALSMDLLRLHDGAMRRAHYVARSLFLPGVPHVSRIPLPRRLTRLPVYVPIKIAQDAAMLPLLRIWRKLRTRIGRRPIPNDRDTTRAAIEQVLATDPRNPAAWETLGDSLFNLGRYEAAIACYDRALAMAPESSDLWGKRIAAAQVHGKTTGDFDAAEQATPDPRDADGWARRSAFLASVHRFSEAIAAAEHALAINPRHPVAIRVGIRCRISACDWRRREDDERRIAEAFSAGVAIIAPAGNRAISDSEAQNLLAARLWIKPFVRPAETLWRGRKYRHDRIRLAYLCSEYRNHPVGRQIVGVFEHHDRARFETTAIALDRPSASAIRSRIEAACDQFIGAHDMNDRQAAGMIHDMEIDIAIDLDRLAARARPGILAYRPAALQISYFGNAGTTGAPFFDYIIADRTLIPGEHFGYYTEKVIYLPNSYQCNDSRHCLPQSAPSRAKAGLPEAGFVYCCFNNVYKVNPPVFGSWMRLLRACPGSILWLLSGEASAIDNLRREAATRGIAPERLVFAPYVPNDDHIARHRLADLFLDTLPCNAHATASDALRAGLPVLTCLGNTFAGRVGASLLRAVGLPEMVTGSLTEYEDLALALTRDPPRLAAIRTKLARNRDAEPLFDTARFTRDLETAYTAIWRRQQAGLSPQALAV